MLFIGVKSDAEDWLTRMSELQFQLVWDYSRLSERSAG
jgi:hypothetical protein